MPKDSKPHMDDLRTALIAHSFLYDDPDSFVAGVDRTMETLERAGVPLDAVDAESLRASG
ncbi:hypothetical protein BH20ACT9_BH20ACT9_01620 [soil metagenome]